MVESMEEHFLFDDSFDDGGIGYLVERERSGSLAAVRHLGATSTA